MKKYYSPEKKFRKDYKNTDTNPTNTSSSLLYFDMGEIAEKYKEEYNELIELDHLTRSEMVIYDNYLKAITDDDEAELAYLRKFGESPRHVIMNLDDFQHAQNFGLSEIAFDSCGWLISNPWARVEEIPLKTKKENAVYNYIEIGEGINGKFSHGIHYNYGAGCGGSRGLGVHGEIFEYKEDAIQSALFKMKELFEKHKHETDSTNFKIPYMNQVIAVIDKKIQEYGFALPVTEVSEPMKLQEIKLQPGLQLTLF